MNDFQGTTCSTGFTESQCDEANDAKTFAAGLGANHLEASCDRLGVAQIPSGLKLRHNQGKYVFKKALEGVVPRDVLTRSKKALALPVAEWFRGELKAFAREVLIDQRDDVLDRATAAMCWNQHRGGRRSRSALLWSPSMFQTRREVSKAA